MVDSNKRSILVLGGTGRVGGSTVRAMRSLAVENGWDMEVIVGGRKEANFQQALARWATLEQRPEGPSAYPDVRFVNVDLGDETGLHRTMASLRPDLIIHTAGVCVRCM